MSTDSLLGKSRHPRRDDKPLLEHTTDVVEAAERLFGAAGTPTPLGEAWLRFFKVPDADRPRFHPTLLAACLFHDWGKANEPMQAFFHGRHSNKPRFNHEHLSVLLLGSDGVRGWVQARERKDIDWGVLLAAVGSHHLRFEHETFAPIHLREAVPMLLGHADFGRLMDETARRLGLTGRPALPPSRHWGFGAGVNTWDLTAPSKKLSEELYDIKSSQLLSAVRAALIAADAVGSGLPRTGHDIGQWVRERFEPGDLCDERKIGELIDKRVDDLKSRNKWEKWNDFQDACEHLPARSLLLAPCGSGKTLAAWRWVRARVAERPAARVLFLYPTRATATEGFKDYVSWAPEDDAALLHGTAGYDLDGMFEQSDPRRGADYGGTDPRLWSLQHWSKRVFSATADQFFAFLSYGYGPTCLLPLLTDSVVVVDEVHSFDKAMFSALLGFLEAFDVPVLCMTATLQAPRQVQIAKAMGVGCEVYGYDRQPADLAELAAEPRYRVRRLAAEAEAGAKVREAVAAGKRVLWVVNQVSRAQAAAASLAGVGCPVVCYHSRFKLDDRRDRHREAVAAMQPRRPAAVVVSTQVCEMSLDLDADVLVTEECPISSLIQRMGRCRRGRDELKEKGPGDVFVYRPDGKERVYDEAALAGLAGFVACLEGLPAASQTDLEAGLEEHGDKTVDASKVIRFLEWGAYAAGSGDSFRDIEPFNAQAVLDTEVEAYLEANRDRQPGYVVPVPRKFASPAPGLPRWLKSAPAAQYDPLTGYHDEAQ